MSVKNEQSLNEKQEMYNDFKGIASKFPNKDEYLKYAKDIFGDQFEKYADVLNKAFDDTNQNETAQTQQQDSTRNVINNEHPTQTNSPMKKLSIKYKILIGIGAIILILFVSNPTQMDFQFFLSSQYPRSRNIYEGGRSSYWLIFSIYSDQDVKYIGIFKNFIAIDKK